MEEEKDAGRSCFFDPAVFCGLSGAGIVRVGPGRWRIFLGEPWKPEFFISFHAAENQYVPNAGNDAQPRIWLR